MIRQVWEWLFGPERDAAIDGLIERNKAKPVQRMEAVDWRKVERAGQRRWQEALRGQRKLAGQPELRPVPFRRA